MAITQREMMAVIVAGTNFRQAWEQLRELVQKYDSISELSSNPYWASFYSVATHPFMTAVHDATLLEVQLNKYRTNWRYNERKARQMRRKRARLNPSAQLPHQLPTIEQMLPTPTPTPQIPLPEPDFDLEESLRMGKAILEQEKNSAEANPFDQFATISNAQSELTKQQDLTLDQSADTPFDGQTPKPKTNPFDPVS